jgi:hypothetical protein
LVFTAGTTSSRLWRSDLSGARRRAFELPHARSCSSLPAVLSEVHSMQHCDSFQRRFLTVQILAAGARASTLLASVSS